MNKTLKRRDFLRLIGGAGAVFALSSCASPFGSQVAVPTKASSTNSAFVPDVELVLRATTAQYSILEGQPTNVLTYESELLTGEPSTLQALAGSYLGPIIRVQKGQKVRIHFRNDLDSESIIHWHGLYVPDYADAHPRYAIKPGETYIYEFEVRNRAGSYWYHPHPDGKTGGRVYQGLAGLFLVSDKEEAALPLPTDDHDVPLVIQDRTFDANNQFLYSGTEMMSQMMGVLGDQILINGQANFVLSVATRAYRLRLLNGSNSRIYKLAWSDQSPLTVIGTDGGLLEKPIKRDYVTLSPGERVELWASFDAAAVGTELELLSLPFTGVETAQAMGAMEGMEGGDMAASPANGEQLSILKVRVERKEEEKLTLPERLAVIERNNIKDAIATRRFSLSMEDMNWTINGKQFEMEGVTEEETVKLGTTEVWEFINQPGRGHMADFMAHPIHIHGPQFEVLERHVDAERKSDWESVSAGYVDDGWKDTVLVMPGEQVKVLLKFSDYEGLFMYHCHNLEHEDIGMMRNYLVQA